MTERVRAILVTGDDTDLRFVTFKRIMARRAPFWALPGGGVEPEDATQHAALVREIGEELGGTADIGALVAVHDRGQDRNYFYVGRLTHYDLAARSGPEFTDPRRGLYLLDLIPLTTAALAAITLVPPQIAELIADTVAAGARMLELPDLHVLPGAPDACPRKR